MNLTYRFLGGQAGWLFIAQECGFHGTISHEQPTNNGSAVLLLYLVRQQERCASWAVLYLHTRVQTHIYYATKWFCHSAVMKFSSCAFLINFFLFIWSDRCVSPASYFSFSDIWKPPPKYCLIINTPWNVDSTRNCTAQLSYALNSFFHLTVQNFIVFFIRSGGVLVHHVQKSQR